MTGEKKEDLGKKNIDLNEDIRKQTVHTNPEPKTPEPTFRQPTQEPPKEEKK